MLALALLPALAACQEAKQPLGVEGAATGFLGLIVGEEPRAVLSARDVLSAGGSAADAAVAGFFTLAATYPAAAGLGGGGACVVYDRASDRSESLSFPLTAPKDGGPVALPGALRAMAVLHARYGRLNWGQLVAPAESLARFGHPASRALVQRQREAAAAGIEVAGLFSDGAEAPLEEGRGIRQVALSGTLGIIRSRGVGVMYGGALGRAYVEAVGALGGRTTLQDLRDYRVTWQPAPSAPLGNHQVLVPSGWPSGAALHAALATQAGGIDPVAAGNAAEGAFRPRPPGDATGFIVMVPDGSGVSCVFTMGRPFGLGQVAPGLGILAAPADPGGASEASPVLVANPHTDQSFFAGAGHGPAPAMLAVILQALVSTDTALEPALERSRAVDPDRRARLQTAWCPGGVRDEPERCQALTDPLGAGYAIGGDL